MRSASRAASAFAVALSAMALSATCASADERPQRLPRDTLARASTCYVNLDYPCVTDLLALLPVWYEPPAPGAVPPGVRLVEVPLLLEAGRILGVSHLVLDQTRSARRVFRWLLALDPGYVLAGSEIPPRYIQIFLEVRAELIAPPVAHEITAVAAGRALGLGLRPRVVRRAVEIARLEAEVNLPRPLQLELGLRAGAGWVGLTRRDAEVFSDAAGFLLGVDLFVDDTGYLLSADVGGSIHDVKLEDLIQEGQDSFRIMHLMVSGGREWRFAWFGLRPSLGVGMGAFGVSAFFEEVGPAVSARLSLDAHAPTAFLLSLRGELRSVTVFDGGPLTSVIFIGGLDVGTRF